VNDRPTPLDVAERALRDSETRLQQVLDNSSALIFAKDPQGRYLFVNREFERIARRRAAEVIGHTDEEVFPPEVATRFRYNDLRVLHEKRAFEFEEAGDFGEGLRTYLAAKFPLFDAAGDAYAVCGVATDISDRKRLEEALSSAALAVSQAEGEALYRELARYLATILDVDAVFIATRDETTPRLMNVRAFHLDGATIENFSYELAGTPCQVVLEDGFQHYPCRLADLFPHDKEFLKLGFQGYAGYPLVDSRGQVQGLLAVVTRRSLGPPAFVESVLRIFAVRVNAELERVAGQQALRASQDSYREIFEASEDAIFVHDWDTGAILDANPQACGAYGYSHEEFRSVRLADISSGVPPYTEEDGLRWIERAKVEGSVRFEWHRRSRDGSLHWDEVRLKAARIGGQPRVLAFSREITEHKRAEQVLRASEEQYRTVFNESADALVLWNSRSERVDVNPAYERMYGFSREEVLIGLRARELPEEHRLLQESIVRRTLEGESYCGEIETARRSGERFPIEVRTVPIRYRGEPHVLAMIRDLTERRRVEEERSRLEAQLRQAQRMEAIGQLTGGIAHDFNNLLTGIMGYVALAAERETTIADRRLAGYLAQAQRSCERARDLIQQMLMFSRGQHGSPRPVALGRLVEESLAALRPTLPAPLDLRLAVAPELPAVRADPLQVEQVLLNLCINARDACEGAGTLEVEVRPARADGVECAGCRACVEGDYVELVVADSGPGIAPAVVERIFDPFFSTKENGKGTGMGLAIVHGIVHEHGGHVLVDTGPGGGARFRVLWPALPEGPVDEARKMPGAAGASVDRRIARPALAGSVLVVDDETIVGEFMRELLETWGLQAACVSSAQAALDLVVAAPDRFDVVITDQSMPRMSGLQLAQALRAARPELPVILYTGYAEGLARSEVETAGIRAVLRKPVEPGALEAALAGVLGADRRGG
jgi:PAS domain S-box-containing protein